MVIGILQIELSIPDAFSLKDKRQSVRSLKDRIRHGYNVSIAEVGALDQHRRALLGIAMVSNDKVYVESVLNQLVNLIKVTPLVGLEDYQIDYL
jgi:uncharacterized protein YlxP (DUF503 family)